MKNIEKIMLSVAATIVLATGVAHQAFAQSKTQSPAQRTAIMKQADRELGRRIGALSALSARIGEMTLLPASDSAPVASLIQSQLTLLSARKKEIDSEALTKDPTELKDDVDSITNSYPVFALILSQGTIEVTADRSLTIVGILNDLGAKFSDRIAAAQSPGKNVTSTNATLANFNGKVSDANAQTAAIISEIVPLAPAYGDPTISAFNTAALKDARLKMQTVQQDFTAAGADAGMIAKTLAAWTSTGTASSSTTSSLSTSASSR